MAHKAVSCLDFRSQKKPLLASLDNIIHTQTQPNTHTPVSWANLNASIANRQVLMVLTLLLSLVANLSNKSAMKGLCLIGWFRIKREITFRGTFVFVKNVRRMSPERGRKKRFCCWMLLLQNIFQIILAWPLSN